LIVRTNLSACAFKFGDRWEFYRLNADVRKHLQKLCRKQRITVVDQIPFPIYNPVLPGREIPGNLLGSVANAAGLIW
jgi:hypothetical protein